MLARAHIKTLPEFPCYHCRFAKSRWLWSRIQFRFRNNLHCLSVNSIDVQNRNHSFKRAVRLFLLVMIRANDFRYLTFDAKTKDISLFWYRQFISIEWGLIERAFDLFRASDDIFTVQWSGSCGIGYAAFEWEESSGIDFHARTCFLRFFFSFQYFIFRVKRGPFVEDFYQCVTYEAYAHKWQEQLYTTFTLVLMYVIPLVVLFLTYNSTFKTISGELVILGCSVQWWKIADFLCRKWTNVWIAGEQRKRSKAKQPPENHSSSENEIAANIRGDCCRIHHMLDAVLRHDVVFHILRTGELAHRTSPNGHILLRNVE